MSDSGRSGRSTLAPGEIIVWTASPPAVSEADLAWCRAILPEDEQRHVARFHFERHRREATVSRALVRLMLAEYTHLAPLALRYRRGPFGQPFLEPDCGTYFNSTNHPGLVACAVSLDAEIGIDVEPIARGPEILGIASTVFSPPELESLFGLSERARNDRAVSLWTCKEAYIKARGLGLSAPLQEIALTFPEGDRPHVGFLSELDRPEGWWVETRDVDGFRVAVVTRTSTTVSLVVSDATRRLARSDQ